MQTSKTLFVVVCLVGALFAAACSKQEPPKPAAKPSVASSFGTPAATAPADPATAPAATRVAPPDVPGQATFGPGPRAGFTPGAQKNGVSPDAMAKLAEMQTKAEARRAEAAKREAQNGGAQPPALPPNLDRNQ